jgi:SAM-dependent methyltransferase
VGPDFARNRAFYDRLAATYDAQLSRNPYDILARRAFQDLVARHVPPGSTLLDFGCGTGLDALVYAEQGYRVLAYDNSPGMVAELRQRCPTHIGSGRIVAHAIEYPSFFPSLPMWPAPSAVAANFAVLNSIRDAGPLFELFARHLTAPGWVIASVLNPIHWSKIRTLEAWRSSRGHTNEPYASYLHSVDSLRRAARKFHLVGRANAGSLVRYEDDQEMQSWWEPETRRANWWERLVWKTPAHRMLGHFVFLVWRRDR